MRYTILIVTILTNNVSGQDFGSLFGGLLGSFFGNAGAGSIAIPGFPSGIAIPPQVSETLAERLAENDPTNNIRGLGFPYNFVANTLTRGIYRNTLERIFPNGFPRNFEKGCNLRSVAWAKVESNLPTFHLDINKPFRIGKCTPKFKDMQYAKLITNTGERFLNMEEDHKIKFNAFYCINDSGRRGVKVESASNPTCSDILNGSDPGCEYKKVKWARIESNLASIPLQINKDHVIGGCSPEFPAMQWARLVTNVGSKNLDLRVDNQIKFNNKLCGGEGFGAEILIHRDCNPALYMGYQKTNVHSF